MIVEPVSSMRAHLRVVERLLDRVMDSGDDVFRESLGAIDSLEGDAVDLREPHFGQTRDIRQRCDPLVGCNDDSLDSSWAGGYALSTHCSAIRDSASIDDWTIEPSIAIARGRSQYYSTAKDIPSSGRLKMQPSGTSPLRGASRKCAAGL
jgi:hypothetical protein